MHRCWLLALVALLLLAGCLSPFKKKEADKGAGGGGGGMSGPPPVSVIVAPVIIRDYAPAVNLTGEVRAAQRAVLGAEVSGRVTRIAARVGESHSKGEGPIIEINPADYQAQLAVAEGQRDRAKAALAEARAGARPEEIAEQEARVAQARATLGAAEDNLRRQQRLFDSGVIPETQLVSAQTAVDTAQGALDAALEVLNRLQHGTRTEQVQAAQAALNAAQASVELAQLNLSKSKVNVAFNAKVVKLLVEVGQSVGPGTQLIEVVSDAPGEAWFNLPEADAAKVHAGDSVEIRSDALEGQVFTGRVVGVSAAADPTTRQFPVRVGLNSKALLPGMAVRGRILQGLPKPTLMVSDDATYESKLGLIVYRMVPPAEAPPAPAPAAEGQEPAAGEAASSKGAANGGPGAGGGGGGMPPLPTAEAVPIKAGEHVDHYVIVLEGDLKPGDMVVTRGKEGIYPTAKIIPTNLMGGDKKGGDSTPADGAPSDAAGKPEGPGAVDPTASIEKKETSSKGQDGQK